MSLATFDKAHDRCHAVREPRQESLVLQERASDVWPDWSSELSEVELVETMRKNRPVIVLWEAIRAVIFSVGLVVALMGLLNLLHVG